jgi:hypothetical protein
MQVFAIASAGTKPLWVLLPAFLIILGVGGILALSVIGSFATRFELSDTGLRVRGDIYGRFIRFDQMRVDAARHVDLAAAAELRPRSRTMGTGLPGYQAGWFRLHNGESGYVYLTDRQKAVYVPTTLGYSVLISPADPEAFLNALKARAQR